MQPEETRAAGQSAPHSGSAKTPDNRPGQAGAVSNFGIDPTAMRTGSLPDPYRARLHAARGRSPDGVRPAQDA